MTHPVAAALRERPAGARVALVVEGGGMRGAVSGGMALGLDELGLAGAFDAAYGSSAGTLNAMWLVSGRVRDGIPTWTDPQLVGELISRRAGVAAARAGGRRARGWSRSATSGSRPACSTPCWRGGPSCTRSPPTSRRPRRSTSTRRSRDPRSLRLALRASAALPLLAGPAGRARRPALHRRRAVGGDPVPRRARRTARRTCSCCARAARARSVTAPGRLSRRADRAGAAPRRRRRWRRRSARASSARRADEALLAHHDADPAMEPAILSIRPPADSPVPSRLERDLGVIRAGLEAGRAAAHAALGGS